MGGCYVGFEVGTVWYLEENAISDGMTRDEMRNEAGLNPIELKLKLVGMGQHPSNLLAIVMMMSFHLFAIIIITIHNHHNHHNHLQSS